jgi:hypothetical protein
MWRAVRAPRGFEGFGGSPGGRIAQLHSDDEILKSGGPGTKVVGRSVRFSHGHDACAASSTPVYPELTLPSFSCTSPALSALDFSGCGLSDVDASLGPDSTNQ